MKKNILIIILLKSLISISQTDDIVTKAYIIENHEIDPSSIEKVENPKISDYEGSFRFGESDSKSQLEIIYSNGRLFSKTKFSEWENNIWMGQTYRESIAYVNGKIIINEINYDLSFLDKAKGLVSHHYVNIDKKEHHYIQFNPDTGLEKPKGNYPETSFVKLTRNDLSGFSKKELKIMRNETYARHGYVFKSGGEMEKYFSQKSWYNNMKKNKNLNFSPIEKHNVDLILELEKL